MCSGTLRKLLAVSRRNCEGRGWCRCCSEFPDPVSVTCLCWEDLNGEMELCHWLDAGKPNQLWLRLPCRVMGKGCSVSPGSVSSSRLWLLCSECRSGCNCWLFPAYPNFSQLRALGMIYFTPACKDFTWAFPFRHSWLWFGVGLFFPFYSFLCRGKFPVGCRGCSGVGVLGTGTWQGLALPSPRARLGKGLVSLPTSLPVGQTGETGTEGWFGARPTAGAAPGFHWSWIAVSAALELSLFTGLQVHSEWQQLSLVPSGCSLTGYKLSCSADTKYQEVQITPNFQF